MGAETLQTMDSAVNSLEHDLARVGVEVAESRLSHKTRAAILRSFRRSLEAVCLKLSAMPSVEDAFVAVDADSDGRLTVDDLMRSSSSLGYPLTQIEASAVLLWFGSEEAQGVEQHVFVAKFQEFLRCPPSLSDSQGRQNCAHKAELEVRAIALACKQQGCKYEDPEFECSDRREDGTYDAESNSGSLEFSGLWARLSEVGSGRLFADKPLADSCVQGAIGDCFMIGAFSCLAHRGCSDIFLAHNVEAGVYAVRHFAAGEWTYTIIDDRMPMTTGLGTQARFTAETKLQSSVSGQFFLHTMEVNEDGDYDIECDEGAIGTLKYIEKSGWQECRMAEEYGSHYCVQFVRMDHSDLPEDILLSLCDCFTNSMASMLHMIPVYRVPKTEVRDGARSLLYGSCSNGDHWVPVLEKVLAKVNTQSSNSLDAYSSIVGGFAGQVVEKLLGGCSEKVRMSWEQTTITSTLDSGGLLEGAQALFQLCCTNLERGQVLSLFSEISDEQEHGKVMKSAGIHPHHLYSLLQAVQLPSGEQLVQLRNPHGSGEWNGDWSDGSSMWTDEAVSAIGGLDVDDDGLFWMSIQDMARMFLTLECTNVFNERWILRR